MVRKDKRHEFNDLLQILTWQVETLPDGKEKESIKAQLNEIANFVKMYAED